jgi:hypothetical protein
MINLPTLSGRMMKLIENSHYGKYPSYNRVITRKSKPKRLPLYSFKHNNQRYVIYDDRDFDHNNFTLKTWINNKSITIFGIERILDYLKQRIVPSHDYFNIEKIFMQEII